MIKVIKHGYGKYRVTCGSCRCYFEYETCDVDNDGTVKCPDCGRYCYHNAELNGIMAPPFAVDEEQSDD